VHWIPTVGEFDATFGPRRQQVADDAELTARRAQFDELAAQAGSDDEPYRSLLIAPTLTDKQLRGRQPTPADLSRRRAQLNEIQSAKAEPEQQTHLEGAEI